MSGSCEHANKRRVCLRWKVLTSVMRAIMVLWVVTPFGLVSGYERFGETKEDTSRIRKTSGGKQSRKFTAYDVSCKSVIIKPVSDYEMSFLLCYSDILLNYEQIPRLLIHVICWHSVIQFSYVAKPPYCFFKAFFLTCSDNNKPSYPAFCSASLLQKQFLYYRSVAELSRTLYRVI
jgi:hypothetical protein